MRRYEPNGIMMLTNEVFRMANKFTYGGKAPETEAKTQVKAEEIEAIKEEVGKVGFPEIINAINSIAETLDAIVGKQNALKENQDAMWNRIAALEAFAYTEPSIKGRIEAIEMKVFGGIAQLEDVADIAEKKQEQPADADTAQTIDAPSLTEDAPLKEAKKKGKSIMSKMFGGLEK